MRICLIISSNVHGLESHLNGGFAFSYQPLGQNKIKIDFVKVVGVTYKILRFAMDFVDQSQACKLDVLLLYSVISLNDTVWLNTFILLKNDGEFPVLVLTSVLLAFHNNITDRTVGDINTARMRQLWNSSVLQLNATK